MLKLSIITINYNNAQGLQKTLESVDSQTFVDYEQIIIDGGSIDGSVEIIKNYESIIKNYCWASEPDNGVYHAQNKGIEKANGEYCLFLNSGDYFCNEKVLETIFSKNSDADIIWGNLIVINARESKIGICKGNEHVTFLDIYSSIIKHQASFIKRGLFKKYGLYDESLKIVADWAFFFKTAGFNEVSLHYVDIDIAYFKADGISYNNPQLCRIERQKVLDQYMPRIMQEDYLLFQKYRNVRYIDKRKTGFFLFKILAKIFKSI